MSAAAKMNQGKMHACMIDAHREIAAQAARWVVEEGLEYGAAKRRAAKQLGLSGRGALACQRGSWKMR